MYLQQSRRVINFKNSIIARMMKAEDYQLLVRERDEAIERHNQSKYLIEKLEEELKNLKEMSPTSEKHFFNMLQKEYVQIIESMREKIKTLQEKLNDELRNGDIKKREIKDLSGKIDELNEKFNNNEIEFTNLKHALKQEQEKNFRLESELIESEKKLYHLQNKYQYLNDLEEERDKLQHENGILSKDCNELEFALEVCHQKIDCYEQQLQKVNEDLKFSIEEKTTITKKNTNFKEEIMELKAAMLNLSSECKKANKDTQNLLDEKIDVSKKFGQVPAKLRIDAESKLNFFDDACSGVFDLCKSVNGLKKITDEYSNKNQELRTKLNSYQLHLKKYRNRILKMNSIISFLKQNLITLQKKMKVTTKKWQHETSGIISKLENRIQELSEKYDEVKHENSMIKKQWRKSKRKPAIIETELSV